MLRTSTITLLFLISAIVLNGQCNEECFNRTVYGFDAGDTGTGQQAAFFGTRAGFQNTTGINNSFFGYQAGAANDGGAHNSFFGHNSGELSIGNFNSFFGQNSGQANTTGFANSFFGQGAGSSSSQGSFNSFFGVSGGSNILGSNCVTIGASAGPPPGMGNVSNRLYIDVKASNDPLIYGEFDNDFVRVNGTFEAMAIGNNSDINKKELFQIIDAKVILDKIVNLNISEWSFKGDRVRHIGPVAQDFYAAFKVGKNEITITTIDADGVALAGIQGLNDKLESENRALRLVIEDLARRVERLELNNRNDKN